MTKTVFGNNAVSAAWFNAMQSIEFNDQDVDGSYPRLTDDSLANTPGNIRYDYRAFSESLRVTAGAGLSVEIAAGVVNLPDATPFSVSGTTRSVPANANTFVWVDDVGLVQTGATLPVRSLPLAKVATTASAIATNGITDLRPRFYVGPIPRAQRAFGGNGSEGDYNLASGSATIDNARYFRNFTVAAGATLNISGSAKIFCSGDVNIQGTIVVSAPVGGGTPFTGVFGAQVYPNTQGRGIGGGGSVNGAAATTYSYLVSPLGSGGAGPWMALGTSGGGFLTTSRGGNGGGAVQIEAAGTVNISGTIRADGEDATSAFSGTAGYSGDISGAGGGSGGLIQIDSLESIVVTAAGLLSVRGGNGGTGWPNPTTQRSGGGGGGGYVVLTAPTVNTTGSTITLSGGTSAYNTGFGAVAGGSFAGQGGAAGLNGLAGQLVVRTVLPG